MSDSRPAQDELLERIHGFVVAGESNQLGDDRWRDFEQFLRDSDEACRLYAEYMDVSIFLPTVLEMLPDEEPAPLGITFSEQPPTILPWAPAFPGNVAQSAMNYISSGWPVAYLVATVVLGIALWIGSLVPASRLEQFAKQSVLPSTFGRGAGGEGSDNAAPSRVTVGQITGMVDCRWEGSGFRVQGSEISKSPNLQISKSLVSLGDSLHLVSGLLEITYDTGARVILQGPVTYEVESAAGGYLSLGKLIAKVQKSEIRNPKSESISKSSNLQLSKFVVRTPTATVTDLGTEFGVEVDRRGATTSHVFRGSIRLQAAASAGMLEGVAEVLHENQSARVEGGSGHRAIVPVVLSKPADFVRALPKAAIKMLDLVDVVAGGNGFSGRRQAGIDPRSGRVVTTLVEYAKMPPVLGDGKYHRVTELPFVDGVFIPGSKNGPVQLDSAGHTFAWFPSIAPYTSGPVWAGKEATNSTVLAGMDYNSPGHAALGLHANKAVTFDLEAIRRANPGWKIVRFRGVAGNTAPASDKASTFADLWVFVDGAVRFQRREITRESGDLPAVVPLGEKDHFLTLAATDGGDGIGWDHTMFGDPRLEMVSVKTTTVSTPPQEAIEH